MKRHIEIGYKFNWDGDWDFGDEEPGCIDPDLSGWIVEIKSKFSQPSTDGQRIYECLILSGPSHEGLIFHVNENALKKGV